MIPTANLGSRHGAPAPRRIEGPGSARRVGEAARQLGLRNVLLITDRGVRAAGLLAPVTAGLTAHGVAWTAWDGVSPNPTDASVRRVARRADGLGVDGFVAVGGGSVLDAAKGAALARRVPGDLARWRGWHVHPARLDPLVLVPTTAGTGSEAQSFALLSCGAGHRKTALGGPDLMPRVSVLDPWLTRSCPRAVALTAGLDALVHAVETATTTAGTPASRAVAVRALAALWAHLPAVLDGRARTADHAAVLRAAHDAGAAIEASMLGAAHATANPLTAQHGVPHGLAVAWMLPAVVRLNGADPRARAHLDTLARAAGIRGDLATALERAFAAWGVPTASAWGLPADAAGACLDDALTQWTGRFNPVPLTPTRVRALYADALG